MTIQEIIDRIVAERQTPGRFPSRLVFVRTFSDYSLLVDELSKICDVTLNLATFCRGDLLPDFNKLKQQLGEHANKRILLLSLSEYLRLCLKRELRAETSEFPSLWSSMQSEHATTKYIIPLFGGRELFDQIVPIVNDRQKDFLWDLTSLTDPLECVVNIYSNTFATAVKTDANCFQEWVENWDTLFASQKRQDFSVISKLCKYASPMMGSISVRIVDEPFAYVASLVSDGQKLKREWGDDTFWSDVSKHVKQGDEFAATVKSILNMGASFDIVAGLARFNYLSSTERSLLWIWYKLYPSDNYYSFAIGKALQPVDIPDKLRDTIFELPKATDNNLSDRTNALRVLTVQYGHEYFSKLDSVLPIEARFAYLTFKTLSERAYAIKTVSMLLRAGADVHTITKRLVDDYSDLAEYISPSNEKDDEFSNYFKWYRQSKIVNRPPEDWPNHVDLDSFDSRNKILQQYSDALPFWVDGLGAEWAPLLVKKLNQLSIATTVELNIGCAIIPSETECNHNWKDDDEKWDRLDKLSHNGMPDDKDYFLCIAHQIDIMGEVAERVSELLSQNDRIIITGDHGSSRLAALMFHVLENFAIDPPKDAIVRTFGRFCELNESAFVPMTDSMEQTVLKGKKYIVMRTYEHFKQSGNVAGGNSENKAVAGEVHGGMTPEEYLVPVILVARKVPLEKKLWAESVKPKAANFNDMGI